MKYIMKYEISKISIWIETEIRLTFIKKRLKYSYSAQK
jgi:hypothetical protein